MKLEGEHIIFSNEEARLILKRMDGDEYRQHGHQTWWLITSNIGGRYMTQGYEIRRRISRCTKEQQDKAGYRAEHQHFI